MKRRDRLEDILERAIPGAGHHGVADADAPDFPRQLGLVALAVIGRGATGWVYRARDERLSREVAVKVSVAGHREALLAEAARTARIGHPAVVPVHRVVDDGERAAIEFGLAPSATLRDRLDRWRLDPDATWPLEQRVALLVGVAGALAAAHARGVVHGDLHPGNVAVGDGGEPYVLDWSGSARGGQFDGTPEYAAPEQLRGEPATAAADVFALGAIAWEVLARRPMRVRRAEEPLGRFIARAAATEAPPLPSDLEPALAACVGAALGPDAAMRPDAAEVHRRLVAVLTGGAEAARRRERAAELVVVAREALARYREGARRLVEEQRVVLVQRAKVPGHAPLAEKQPIWDAEDRVAEIRRDQTEAWHAANDAATAAAAMVDADAAHEVLAELWWERLRTAEADGADHERHVALSRLRQHDRGRHVAILDAPAHVSLTVDTPGATVEIARFVGDRVRRAEVVDVRTLPLARVALPPGSWRFTVRVDGFVDAVYPVLLGRLEHHVGAIRPRTADQIGAGYAYVPGGPFRLGGDPRARNALDPCVPILGDRFVKRTCVTFGEWIEFLNAVPKDVAAAHVPGEGGVFGGHQAFLRPDRRGRYALPDGWDPAWPVTGVSRFDAEAYAAWRTEIEGRRVRLPTEEEWEKASRGADGRSYPWGDAFDPTFCHMRESRSGAPRPWPVGGYPADCSVYGVCDTAGGVREWTASTYADGQAVIRGGTFGDDADDCRCAGRAGFQPPFRMAFVGFRVLAEAPSPRRSRTWPGLRPADV